MIGIVVVSHSPALAHAAVDLARQMVSGDGPVIEVAAGAGGRLGTDATDVAAALSRAASPDGVLVLMDLGSAVLARERAEGRVATVAVEAMSFHRPVRVGDLVSIYATVLREGATSMVIDVEAWVRRVPDGGRLKVTEARFVFVAVDDTGAKRPLPRAK